MTQNEIKRRIVVDEAHDWVHTPYHHQAHIKGLGVDCVWLLLEVYKKVIPELRSFNPGNYSMEWYMHKTEEVYLSGVMKYATQLVNGTTPILGDVALYKVGHCVSHGAIYVGNGLIIHANRKARQVEIVEMRNAELEAHFHSFWTPFL